MFIFKTNVGKGVNMKINSIKTINYTTNSKLNFGAAFNPEIELKYKKLGYDTLFRYGADSEEYKSYLDSIKGLKRLCPDGTINMNKEKDGYGIYLQSPYLKSEKIYSSQYKYELFDLKGLRHTVLNLSAINNGFYKGVDFFGTRNETIKHIKKNIAPQIDNLF